MHVYALISSLSRDETLDLFLTREAAETELEEILEDEPEWNDVLRVEPIQLDAGEGEIRTIERESSRTFELEDFGFPAACRALLDGSTGSSFLAAS
jgi:hypothetical protein